MCIRDRVHVEVIHRDASYKRGLLHLKKVFVHTAHPDVYKRQDALRAIGYALLVLFFVAGVVKTCGSFTELKRPEVAVKTFVRFALAQGAVTYGLGLMMALFSIAQGAVSTIMAVSYTHLDVYKRQMLDRVYELMYQVAKK